MTKTAIILFADLPDFEARAKSFSGFSSQKATRKISSILTHHFYALAQKTTAKTFLIDSFKQKGKSFGEKITNAFAAIYAKGFDNVVCIGNDCPDLDLGVLQKSITDTEAGNVVLGPTFDGGAYLIGIPKHQFNQFNFQRISWQSKQTFISLKASFHTSVVKLGVLSDIDGANDFSFSNVTSPLIQQLLSIIKYFKAQFPAKLKFQKPVFFLVDGSFLKGPPLFSI